MKLNKSLLLAAAPALMLASCSENAWNDHLEGFDPTNPADEVVNTAEYTLTTEDYATIAGLAENKAIAERDGETDALAFIGSDATFVSEEQAQKYLPAFLASTNKGLPYYTWNDGSAIKVTYNIRDHQSAEVLDINRATSMYTISEDDYQMVWGSDDDFVNAFAPGTPASSYLPTILKNKFPDAQEGDYVAVSYNQSATNPIFGTSEASWDAIADAAVGQNMKLRGVVTGICAQGFILTDDSGSILCYEGKTFNASLMPLFSVVETAGIISSSNFGLQMPITSDTYSIVDETEYTYPAPKTVTGADMDAAVTRTTDEAAEYVSFTATASVSGNYYNLNVDGATTAVGSVYQPTDDIKALIEDGKTYTFTGYFTSVSGKGKYYNILVTGVESAAAGRPSRAPLAEVVTAEKVELYKFSGNTWAPASAVVVQPSDYAAMGLTYGNLSGSQPDEYLPRFLKEKYPFAAEEDTKTVAYKYYADKVTSYQAREYVLTEGEWKSNLGATTTQFVKMDNVWKFNPSVSILLPYPKQEITTTYFTTCVNWVKENVPDGSAFISSYGDSEYYSGISAYYGNVDVRAVTALNNAPAGYTGYDGLTDDQVTLLIKKRFCTETMPGALSTLQPDLAPIEGMDVTVTLTFDVYDGSHNLQSAVWRVVAPGQFEYVSSTWVEAGQDADWK